MAQILHDRYELLQLLGRKAGRRTWLAVDLVTQQQVVIKLLLFSSDFEWDALKLFEREAKTLQDLEHAAIPKYLHWFETDFEGTSGFALVQTYIPAQSLESIVQSGRTFSTADLQNIAEQILEILDYLHTRNPVVIHRDLKPSNILLGDRTGNSPGKVSLVDFGSVQNLAVAKGGTITIVGTYGYMPMEQFGDRAVPASDLYSLGATILYLATGKDPADLLSDNLQIQLHDGIPLTSGLNVWIQQLMQMNLKDRPNSAKAAIELLHNPIELPQPIVTLADQRVPRPEKCKFKVHEATDKTFTFSFPNDGLTVIEGSRMTPIYYGYRKWWNPKIGYPHPLWRGILDTVCVIIAALIILPVILFSIMIIISAIISAYFALSLFFGTVLYGTLFVSGFFCQKVTIVHINESNIKLIPDIRIKSRQLGAKYLLNPNPNLLTQSRGTVFQKQAANEVTYKILDMDTETGIFPTSYIPCVCVEFGDRIWRINGEEEEMLWLSKELSYYLNVSVK